MSSISGVSAAANAYQAYSQNSLFQVTKDFRSLGSALQSGNISSAQSALSSFQQDLQNASQNPSNQPFGRNIQANTDYQTLTTAIQSGDLQSAQSAYTNLQKDLQGVSKGHHHHHHGTGGSDTTQPTTSPTTTNNTGPAGSLLNLTA